MNISQQFDTPDSSSFNQEDYPNDAAFNQLIQRTIEVSLLQSQKEANSLKNGIRQKYYKKIVNLTMSRSSQKCSVCLDKFVQGQIIKRLPCGHIFHRYCAKQWLRISKNCPICRTNIEFFFKKLEKQGKNGYEAMKDKKIKPKNS